MTDCDKHYDKFDKFMRLMLHEASPTIRDKGRKQTVALLMKPSTLMILKDVRQSFEGQPALPEIDKMISGVELIRRGKLDRGLVLFLTGMDHWHLCICKVLGVTRPHEGLRPLTEALAQGLPS